MSSGSHSWAAWLKQNYEKMAVVAVLVGLLASTAILFLRIRQGRQRLADTDQEMPKAHQTPISPVELGTVQEAESRLAEPKVAGAGEQRMFTSELRVFCVKCQQPIPYEATQCPFCGASQPEATAIDPAVFSSANDGIPDNWKTTHGLDPLDPYLHLRDLDRDGFSVLDEYNAKTDPNDPGSSPPAVMKLRLEDTRSKPFRLRFSGLQQLTEGESHFAINDRVSGRTYFRKIGDVIPDTGYTIVKHDPANRTLTLSRDDQQILLRQGEVREDTERVLILRSLLDGMTLETRVGETFTTHGNTYRVLNRLPDGVRVKETGGEEKEYLVRPLTDEERASLQRSSGAFGRPEGFPDEGPEGLRSPRGIPGNTPPPF